jgi:hypothetical protein
MQAPEEEEVAFISLGVVESVQSRLGSTGRVKVFMKQISWNHLIFLSMQILLF